MLVVIINSFNKDIWYRFRLDNLFVCDNVHCSSLYISPTALYKFCHIYILHRQIRKMLWPWNPSQRSLKVIWTDTDRSATYNFLLTLHSHLEPISYRFRNKQRFQSKIDNYFPSPVYLTPSLKGFPLELGIDAMAQKTTMMALPEVKECGILGGCHNILTPPKYFQGSIPPNSRIYVPAAVRERERERNLFAWKNCRQPKGQMPINAGAYFKSDNQ